MALCPFCKSIVNALQTFPAVNAEIQGEEIVYKNYYNIGVAVGTDKGLVVPVVRSADQMSFGDIEKEIINLGGKARDGQLSIEELQGVEHLQLQMAVYMAQCYQHQF